MPSLLAEAEPDRAEEQQALNGPSSFDLSLTQALGAGQLTPLATDALSRLTAGPGRMLDPEEANRDYGVHGYLTFEAPVSENDAAMKQAGAQRRAFRDDVLSRSTLNPLAKMGLAMGGAMIDPAGLPLFLAPELLGLRGAVEAVDVGRAATVMGKAGRLANAGRGAITGGLEGLAATSLYEGANYGLRRYTGDDDYTLGDSLSNVLLGGVLGAGFGGILGGVLGAAHPRAVRELPETSRLGASALAIERAIGDEAADVAPLVEREIAARRPATPDLAALDDTAGAGPRIAARELDDAVAVTTRGTEVPVRYALVELGDLVTSHTDDLERNPAFPEALQPRDRTRAGSQAGNFRLEQELNPKRLMRDTGAETGAPMIAPDGLVESGNGRVIALRRSARTGSDAYGRYLDELRGQGFDTEGMTQPVLVRLRQNSLSGEGRAALAREMNAAPTETMGASEQAMADAATLDDAMLSRIDGSAHGDRSFAQAFLARVAPDQQNVLADANGRLSAAGANRIKAALVARAYQDPRLVEAVFEAADPNIKTLGAALSEAAPAWAKMRSLAARGEIPEALDITPQLQAAVDIIRAARDARTPVDEAIAQRLGAVDLFTGQAAVDAETEAFLRLFFRDEGFKRGRSADKVAWALKDYARQASDATPGPNLFGDVPDGDATLILQGLARKFAADEPFPAQADLEGLAPEPDHAPVVDLQPDAGGGGREGLQRPGGGGAEGAGGRVVTHTSESLRARLQELGEDSRKLTAEVVAEVERALAAGARVEMVIEGKAHEIVAVAGGQLRDAEGKPWGVTPLMMQKAGDDDRLVIAPRVAPAGVAEPGAASPKPAPLELIDPELKALAERDLGPAQDRKPKDDPAVIAEAIRAAAFCLSEGGA